MSFQNETHNKMNNNVVILRCLSQDGRSVKFMFGRQRSNANPRQGRATTSSPFSTFRQFIFLSICCSY